MSSTPKVSVIVSTYNRCGQLKRALESILAQTLHEIEVIVVDNASVDQTQSMVQQINDVRLHYVRHHSNLGGPAARNSGIRMAKAELIAFCDDDDQWMPEKLTKQVAKMQSSSAKVGLVYVGAEIFQEDKSLVTQVNHPKHKGNVYKRLLLSTILSSVSSVLIKRECFDKVGHFDESLTSCQDWDMWLRMAKEYEFEYVDEILVRINMHGNQISTNYEAMIPGRTRMIEKHKEEFRKHPDIYLVHLKRMGKLHCINGTWAMAVGWFKEAIRVRPFEIIKITAWCLLQLPWIKLFAPQRNFKRYRPTV